MTTKKTNKISIINTLSVKDDQVLASSIDIAGVFNKRHDNVVQAIEKIDCSPEFTHLNFQVSEYKLYLGNL